MSRFLVPKQQARVVNNLADVVLTSLVGDESMMDISMASMREYINVHQKLKILGWVANATVADYLEDMRKLSNTTLLIAANAASYMHSAAKNNMDIDKRLFLGAARVSALYALIGTYPNESDIADVFDLIVKPSEVVRCLAKACVDESHPNAFQVVSIPNQPEPFTIIPQADLTAAAGKASDGDFMGLAKTFGVSAICIAKTVLFRQAHHIQQDEIYERQYGALENALGISTDTQRMRLNTFVGRLESSRTLAHPFMGSCLGRFCKLLGDTERQAIQIRVKGFGAGWAKVGLVHALWSKMSRDRALTTYMALRLGNQLELLKTIVTAFAIPDEDGPTAEYCMVVGGFVDGVGGTPPNWVRSFLDSNAQYIQAALDSIGGTVASSRTFSKQAGDINVEKRIIKTLKTKLASDITPDLIEELVPDRTARDELMARIHHCSLVDLNDVGYARLDHNNELVA